MTADTAGGVWIHALSLCAGLAAAGVSVRLVALGRPSPEQRDGAARLCNVELVVRPVRLEWMPEPWCELDALEPDLLELSASADLVHLNHLVHGHLDWRRPVITVVHSCVSSWFEAVRGVPAPPEWDTYRQRVARSLSASDHVVAPSAWMLEQAGRHYGPLHGRSVIANGSDAPMGAPDGARTGLLAAGRVWDEAKNLGALIALAPRLEAPLRIAGPRQRPHGTAVAVDGVQNLHQQALWAEMRRAGIFVAPALYEPFGLGILEAARSGCALVLGDIPTLREIWGDAARYVDPRRPDEWVRVLDDLAAHDDERIRLAHAARARAAGYTLERMAQCYLALYRRTVDQPVKIGAEGFS